MKIIDAHLHFAKESYFDEAARAAGHENSVDHLARCYSELGIERGVVMSNRTLEPSELVYPPFLSYCVGLDRSTWSPTEWEQDLNLIERNLQRRECVGIKLYPGYLHFYVSDDSLAPLYRLAEKYDKPVAVHTGLTAMSSALLKYSHPMVLDEAAAKYSGVRFVMCHLGEPWIADAAAVLMKNPNVAADLSGMLERKIPDMGAFLAKKKFYVEQLRGWLELVDDYSRIMFGTDWPLANIGDYVEFVKAFIPSDAWEDVFHRSAEKIYRLE